MSKKKVFALRITEEMYAAIEKWAADEFRSANGQVEWMISKMLKDAGRWHDTQVTPNDEEEVN